MDLFMLVIISTVVYKSFKMMLFVDSIVYDVNYVLQLITFLKNYYIG